MYITLGCDNVQKQLSKWQGCLLFGALVSPFKAVASIAQIVSGAVITVFAILGAIISCNQWDALQYALTGGQDFAFGWVHLAYSIFNFFTLGAGGCLVEKSKSCFCCLQ